MIPSRIRVALRSALVLIAMMANACGDEAPGLGSSSPSTRGAGLPTPIEPQWVTSADLEHLTEIELNDLDFFVFLAAIARDDARSDAVAAAVLLVKANLHRLFYPVAFDKLLHPADDPDFYATLVAFEQRARLDVDGKFTFGEANRLRFLADVEGEPAIRTGIKLVHGNATYAAAEGTWVLQGDEIAFPVNRSRIECWRTERICTVFTANLDVPSEREIGPPAFFLATDIDRFEIVSWRTNEVQASSSGICRESTLTLNWSTERVFQVVTDFSRTGCAVVGLEPSANPRITTLESGDAIERFLEKRRNVLEAVSDARRARIRSLLDSAQR